MYTRAGDLLCRPVLCCAARERRSLPSFRRRRFSGLPLSERWSLPGPAPAGGPTSCAPKKSAEEGRSRGLPPVPLRNPREYLAITRRLPPLPTGTPAEGSIQVADAPNGGNEMCGELAGQGPQLTCAQPSAHVQPAACSRPVPPAPAKRAAARSGGRFCMQFIRGWSMEGDDPAPSMRRAGRDCPALLNVLLGGSQKHARPRPPG